MQYPDAKCKFYCEYAKKDITIITRFSNFSEAKIPIHKRCSEWENCNNRDFCEHGKISKRR